MSTETNFVAKVIAFVKGGDEGKIKRFAAKAVKFFKKQVSIRADEIEDLNERIVDLTEKYDDLLVNVSFYVTVEFI